MSTPTNAGTGWSGLRAQLAATEVSLLRVVRVSDEDHGGLDGDELREDEYDAMQRLCDFGLVEAIGEYGEAPDGEEDEREMGDASNVVYRVTGAGVAVLSDEPPSED